MVRSIIDLCSLYHFCAKVHQNESVWSLSSWLSRVAHDSKVNIEYLNPEQIRERFYNIRMKKKELERMVKQLENREAKQKKKDSKEEARELRRKTFEDAPTNMQQRQHDRAPLLPWPFYLNYNPMVASEYALPASMPTFSGATTTKARVAAAPVPAGNMGKSGITPAKNEDHASNVSSPVKDADKEQGDNSPAEKKKEAVNVELVDEPLGEAEVDIADGHLV